MRFSEAVKLLAAPYAVQAPFLGPLPENVHSPDFKKPNNIYRMATLYRDSLSVFEGDHGSEGYDNWLARTEFPQSLLIDRENPLWLKLQMLTTAVGMLLELDRPFHFTDHGLRSAYEWRLIRYLANDACASIGWLTKLQYPTFDDLWRELAVADSSNARFGVR